MKYPNDGLMNSFFVDVFPRNEAIIECTSYSLRIGKVILEPARTNQFNYTVYQNLPKKRRIGFFKKKIKRLPKMTKSQGIIGKKEKNRATINKKK